MYDEIFCDIQAYLENYDNDAAIIQKFPFRKRSGHIWRVYKWAERLAENGGFDAQLDRDSLFIAALFHDIGYASKPAGMEHAENSAVIFRQYAAAHNYVPAKIDFIEYLIGNHSKKEMLQNDDTPLELVILMEADLLDETGALSIIWDCMAEGAQAEQSFTKTYEHIKNYSGTILLSNPMRTEIAKKYWSEKQELMAEFIRQLERDIL